MRTHFHWVLFLSLAVMVCPTFSVAQEMNRNGWAIPDLRGLIPYSMTIRMVDGVEKVVEMFDTPGGGNVAKIRGNGKVFAYAVDANREPPIDYLILDPDGSGKFTLKFKSADKFKIPEWVSR